MCAWPEAPRVLPSPACDSRRACEKDTYEVEDDVYAVGLHDKGDERGGDGHRVDRAALDDDAQNWTEEVRRAVLRRPSSDCPNSARQEDCKQDDFERIFGRRSGRHLRVEERFVPRVSAYTAVIHRPVWTANTSPVCFEEFTRAMFNPIEPPGPKVSQPNSDGSLA